MNNQTNTSGYLRLDIYSPYDVDMGNSNFDWESFKSRIDKGPKPIKDLIFAPETAQFLQETSGNFNLSEDQSRELARIIRDTLLATVPVGDTVKEIGTRLQLEPKIAEAVSDSIISGLLIQVKDIIGLVQEERSGHGFSGKQSPSLHEQNLGNVVDLRNRK